MRNRHGLFLSVLLIAALLVAACGPSTAPSAAPQAPAAATTSATEAAPTEAPAAPTTAAAAPAAGDGPALTIWADERRTPVLASLGAEFEAQYGLRVVVTEKAIENIRDDFKVAAPAGEGPDIIVGAHDWLGELVVNGLLAEIELGANADQFLPAAVQAFTYNGKLYGMPYATENVAFIYNPEIVTEVPETWTEVMELSAQLEEEGVVDQGFIIQERDPYHFFPIQTAFGGYVFGLTETGYSPEDIGIDSEGSIAAANWLDTMYKEGHLQAGAAVNSDLMYAAYGAGDVAMMITGPWALNTLRESGQPYAVAPFPSETQEAQPFLGVQGFMVNALSEDILLAQTFLQEFVATEETMQAIFDAEPRPSAFIPVRENISDPDIAAFAEAGENGLAMPAIPEMSAVWSAWGDAMQLVSQQTDAPDVAFQNAAEQIRELIAGE